MRKVTGHTTGFVQSVSLLSAFVIMTGFVCLFFLSGFGFLGSAKAQATFELHNLHWPGTVFTRGDYHYPDIPFGIVSKIIPQKRGIMHPNCG